MSVGNLLDPPEQVGERWTAGQAYDAYMGRWSRAVARRFVAWLAVPPSGVWVDLGCGTGSLTAAICDIAAPLSVTGVDPSQGYVDHAQASACDVAGFVVGDTMALPFEDEIFDVAVSGLVLNVLADPAAALREQARVVVPGGTVAAFVWDYGEGMQLLRRFWDAARRITPSAAALDEGVRFRDATIGGLTRAFERAGLDVRATTALEVEQTYRDFDELWRPFLAGEGLAPGFVARLDDTERAALRDGLARELPQAPDGSIRLTARAWAVRATT